VASRWRIRHKLMLGLGLVVATMVLLLGGTIFGVWSYYLDMKSLRDMTAQLHEADDVKAAVSDIRPLIEVRLGQKNEPSRSTEEVKPSGTDMKPGLEVPLGQKDGLIPKEREAGEDGKQPPLLPEEQIGDPAQAREKPPRTLEEALDRVTKKLTEYEYSLTDTSNHEAPPSTQESLALIQHLRTNLKTLAQKLSPTAHRQELEVEWGPCANDKRIEALLRQEWAKLLDKVIWDSRDLCAYIDKDIHDRIDRSRRNYQITFWIAFPASIVCLLLVCGMLGSFYAWVFHPIRDLEAGVIRVAKGDFDHRIEVHSGDEMEDLGAAFNDMMQRLQDLYSDLARQVNERSRQLVRSERLASVGFLAAGVAHEINNPLASIAFCSEALERRLANLLHHLRGTRHFDEEEETFTKYLKMIQGEAFRCKEITEKLLTFSRPGERRREKTDLRELIQLVLDVTQHLPDHRGKEIKFEMSAERLSAGAPITAWVNSEEIKSVVLNLVINALHSMDEGGQLTIRLSQRGDMAEMQLTDTGCGMTQEVLENIFEPFYTRCRTGKGTGLGLTISHRIITQHGGEIEATSAGPNQGSTFIVRLPVHESDTTPVLSGPGSTPGKNEEQAVAARSASARAA
jgi:two-component system, NtrC family, sensor kinase